MLFEYAYIHDYSDIDIMQPIEMILCYKDNGEWVESKRHFPNLSLLQVLNEIGSKSWEVCTNSAGVIVVKRGYEETADTIVKASANKNLIATEVDKVYNAYPARDPSTERGTGKTTKDKTRIAKLLTQGNYTADSLIKIIYKYIDECRTGNTYMKNFCTFLNNIPDMDAMESPKSGW
jgi:hypothetical protein